MSKEAMTLALEALEYIEHNYMSLPAPAEKAITALREALAEQPAQSKPLTDEQITAGAQALCQQMAEACNVDAGDQWQLFADTFKEDAKAVLTAAAKLREKNA